MRVKVNQINTTQAIVNQLGTTQIVSIGVQGPAGPSTIASAADIDITNLQSGSVLVYNTNTEKWTSTTLLDSQYVEAGEF